MSDSESDLTSVLVDNLARVVGFVQFAEAKNAALLAFSSAWIVALSTALSTAQVDATWAMAFQWGISAFLVSAVFSLLSFLPKTNLTSILKSNATREPNLLYFGDISKLDPKSHFEDLADAYRQPNGANTKYNRDLAAQIYANSTIIVRKFRLFNFACWISLGALLLTAQPAIISVLGALTGGAAWGSTT